MSQLTLRDRELVALGAALAANCIPCVEYHMPKAREAGISDTELNEIILLADKVRQVPAKKVLQVADSFVRNIDASAPATDGQCAGANEFSSENTSCC